MHVGNMHVSSKNMHVRSCKVIHIYYIKLYARKYSNNN